MMEGGMGVFFGGIGLVGVGPGASRLVWMLEFALFFLLYVNLGFA